MTPEESGFLHKIQEALWRQGKQLDRIGNLLMWVNMGVWFILLALLMKK